MCICLFVSKITWNWLKLASRDFHSRWARITPTDCGTNWSKIHIQRGLLSMMTALVIITIIRDNIKSMGPNNEDLHNNTDNFTLLQFHTRTHYLTQSRLPVSTVLGHVLLFVSLLEILMETISSIIRKPSAETSNGSGIMLLNCRPNWKIQFTG